LKNNPKHLLITKKPLAKPILLTSRLQLMTQIWNIRGGACWTVGKWRCSKLTNAKKGYNRRLIDVPANAL